MDLPTLLHVLTHGRTVPDGRYKGLTASLLGLTHGAIQLPIYEKLKDLIRCAATQWPLGCVLR